MSYYVGIDNGVTGSLGILNENQSIEIFQPILTKKCLNYQKTKEAYITRIDVPKVRAFLFDIIGDCNAKVLIERPLVNPQMFTATMSAIRSLEAVLIILENLGLGYEYVDSKAWQKQFFPQWKKGTTNLKQVSLEVGCRHWPMFEKNFKEHGDADGLFIAEFCRLYYNQPPKTTEEQSPLFP